MVSCAWPIGSEKLTTRSLPKVRRTALSTTVRKPPCEACTSYWPTSRSGTRYRPSSLVVTVRITPVLTFLTCTVAPGTAAPDGSVTVPEMTPFVAWAFNSVGRRTNWPASHRQIPIYEKILRAIEPPRFVLRDIHLQISSRSNACNLTSRSYTSSVRRSMF